MLEQIKSDWWAKDIKLDQNGSEANWANIQIRRYGERDFVWTVAKNNASEIAGGNAISLKQAEYLADQAVKDYVRNGVGGFLPRTGML